MFTESITNFEQLEFSPPSDPADGDVILRVDGAWQPSIITPALVAGLSDYIAVHAPAPDLTPYALLAGASFTGTVTAPAFVGSGSSLSGITPAQVGLGNVLNAKQVTSVSLAVPSIYASPVNFSVDASGNATGALAFNAQAANLIFAGPASGSSVTPTMRALVAADIPGTLNATTFSGNVTVQAGKSLSVQPDALGSTNPLLIYSYTGQLQSYAAADGNLYSQRHRTLDDGASLSSGIGVQLGSAHIVAWAVNDAFYSASDLVLSRPAASTLKIGDGGSGYGDLQCGTIHTHDKLAIYYNGDFNSVILYPANDGELTVIKSDGSPGALVAGAGTFNGDVTLNGNLVRSGKTFLVEDAGNGLLYLRPNGLLSGNGSIFLCATSVRLPSNGVFNWYTATDFSGAIDATFTRSGPSTFTFGNNAGGYSSIVAQAATFNGVVTCNSNLNLTGTLFCAALNAGGLSIASDGTMNSRAGLNLINKAGNGWLPVLAINSTGTENVYDLSHIGAATFSSLVLSGTSGSLLVGETTAVGSAVVEIKNKQNLWYPFRALRSDANVTLYGIWETATHDGELYILDGSGTTRVYLTTKGSSYLTGGRVLVNTQTDDGSTALQVNGAISNPGVLLGYQGATNYLTGTNNLGGTTTFRVAGVAVATYDVNGQYASYGINSTFGNLAVPTGLSATPQGTTGSTTYTYQVTSVNSLGQETVGSIAATTTTGNATLTSVNKNHIVFNQVPGSSFYWVYRTVGGVTQGRIGLTSTTTFDDTGLVGNGVGPPTSPTGTKVVIQRWKGQTGNFQEWQDETGAVMAAVDAGGNVSSYGGTSYLYGGRGANTETRLGEIFSEAGLFVASNNMRFSVASGAGRLFKFSGGSNIRFTINADTGGVGFFGTTPPAQATVTGSKGANAALASLLTALAATGLIVDSST